MAIGQLGMLAAKTGAAFGINALGKAGQLRQQEELQKQQIKGAKELKDYDTQKQFEMWNKTNYGAQLKHMKEAGLNPALMYGMGGGAGGTTGGGGIPMPTGGQAEGAGELREGVMGMAMMQAQKEVLESQADKNRADAEKTRGVDTEETETRIKDLMQGIENKKAQEQMTKVETTLKELQNFENLKSQEDRLDFIEYQTRRAEQELYRAMDETYISRQTREEKISIVQQSAIEAVIKNELLEAQTDKTRSAINVDNAQIQKMAQDIAQGWKGLEQGDTKVATEKFKAEVQANYPSLMNVIGRGIDDTIDTIFGIGGRGRKQQKAIR